jgi:uncharacterized membrane protein
MSDFIALKREMEEFKDLTAQRQKLYEQFWKERLTWISLILTSWTISVAAILHLIP